MTARFETLGEMVASQAALYGDKPAFRSRTGSVGYRSFRDHCRQVGNGLAAMGTAVGGRVAYLGKNSAEYYEIFAGAAAAGRVLVPINWRLSPPEVAWILEDSGAELLFADRHHAEALAAIRATLPNLRTILPMDEGEDGYRAWRDSQAAAPGEASVAPDDIALQIYTSGTTGKPKGAMLCHRALLAFRSLPPDLQPEWNRWTEDDVSLIVMPQFHIGGTGFGLQTLCAGATGLVMTEFDPGDVLNAIERDGVSKVFTVPSAIQLLLRDPKSRQVDYRRIRTMVYGASPMPLDVLREAMAVFGCGFAQQYGMTEAAGTISVLPPEDHHVDGTVRMRSAGKALPGVEIRIVDPDGAGLPPETLGEVVLKSPTLMSGYWNLPEATAEAFTPDGYFRSGDAGYLDADGYLFIRDRLKDMIVSGGENVYPAEVEAVLQGYPGVREVGVIGVPDDKWGEAVKAVVVPADAATFDAKALIDWARGRLAGYKLPKSVDVVDSLPRNASGKLLRRDLRQPFWAGRDRMVN